MSDAGLYDAIEAEIYTALTTSPISGIVAVAKTMAVEDLIAREGLRAAIGIVDAGANAGELLAVGNRMISARSRWEVSVVVRNDRGRVEARPAVRGFLETIRDRIHYMQSAIGSRPRYQWISDHYVDVADEGLCAAVATFEIQTYFGR